MTVLVIGACNIDIIGKSHETLLNSESNIGEVSISLGGVAKNMATNLFYLGADVSFLTLIGSDNFAKMQKSELDMIGIDYSHSLKRDVTSSTYLAVHDKNADLNVAINDMKNIEGLLPEDFSPLEEVIESFDALVFDTNLSEVTLCYLIERYKHKKIYVDGVSQSKVIRLRKVLPYIDLLKINQYELNALLKIDNCDIIFGVKQLLDKGLKNCIVSHSDEPITYNLNKEIYQSETNKKENILSTMGAGDALISGAIYYLVQGKNMREAVNFGKVVADKTLEVYEACNKDIKKLIHL
ncbi:MAG: carbohydrate kinase family protein [Tenericutes bacterium]|nr:carbohydrate kinase family protein [Mycoplasmatota bacterium]